MITAWLLLFLLPLGYALAGYGWGLHHPAQAMPLLSLLGLPVFLALKRRNPDLFGGILLKVAGVGAVIVAAVFVRLHLMGPVDFRLWQSGLLVAGLGLMSLWVAVGSCRDKEGPGDALWAGAWLLLGWLDPVLPFLGCGVAAFLRGNFLWPALPAEEEGPALSLFSVALLFGLALPKPCWDFGLEPGWSLALAAVGAGIALARVLPALGRRLPGSVLLALLGLPSVAYHTAAVIPWGAALGLASGWAMARTGRPARLGILSGGFLLGAALSFALHANAWIPGLRHLLWLGN
jgi:hypothetical protein